MKKESFISEFVDNFSLMLRLSLIFIVSSLPIITIPISLISCCSIVQTALKHKMIFLLHDYMENYRKKWKRSLSLGVPFLIVIAILLFDIFFYSPWGVRVNIFFFIINCVIFIWVVTVGNYLFPLLAASDVDAISAFKQAILSVANNIISNIVVLVINLIILVMFVFFLPYSMVLLPFAIAVQLFTINKRFLYDGLNSI